MPMPSAGTGAQPRLLLLTLTQDFPCCSCTVQGPGLSEIESHRIPELSQVMGLAMPANEGISRNLCQIL